MTVSDDNRDHPRISGRERARRVREETRIEEVIGSYYALVSEGPRYLRGVDHDSLVVDRLRGRYHWNSRGESGDVIDFLQREERLSFGEALERLDGQPRATRPVPSRTNTEPVCSVTPRLPDPDVVAVLGLAATLYTEALTRSSLALAYLARRGIGTETARRLGLGYCRGGDLAPRLRERGVDLELVRRAGLFRVPRAPAASPVHQASPRELLAGRIVVPEVRSGGPVYLIGRAIRSDRRPRYLGLPLPRPLLGYRRAREAAVAFVVEGVFDWVALAEWGLPGVALAGTNPGPLARKELRELARSTPLYLVPQNDEAGRRAMALVQSLLGRPAAVVELPPQFKDLGELAAHPRGRELFLASLPQELRGALASAPVPSGA